MAAGRTYTPIATQKLNSASSTVTFSSIPSTYTDLVLIINGGNSVAGAEYWLQFNSDTGSSYSTTVLEGNGTTTGSSRITNTYPTKGIVSAINLVGVATQGMFIANIQNYANTTTYKSCLMRLTAQDGLSSYQGTVAAVGLWQSTSAINSITINTVGANMNPGTTITLYGIAAA